VHFTRICNDKQPQNRIGTGRET